MRTVDQLLVSLSSHCPQCIITASEGASGDPVVYAALRSFPTRSISISLVRKGEGEEGGMTFSPLSVQVEEGGANHLARRRTEECSLLLRKLWKTTHHNLVEALIGVIDFAVGRGGKVGVKGGKEAKGQGQGSRLAIEPRHEGGMLVVMR